MIKVACPHCGQSMLTSPRGSSKGNARKRCVYCGKSFISIRHVIQNG